MPGLHLRLSFKLLETQKIPTDYSKSRGGKKRLEKMLLWKIVVLLVIIEILEVGLSTLIKASSSKGMSNYVFAVYSNAVALPPFLILTFFFYRKRPERKKLTWKRVFRIFLTSPIGITGQICKYTGASLSNPTIYSAILDLTPAFAFIIAIISGMEILELRIRSTQAKAIGTIVSVAGALVVTLYKGFPIISNASPVATYSSWSASLSIEDYYPLSSSIISNWILGGFLLAVTSFLTALCYIIQAWILKDYPEPLMVTLLSLMFNTIGSTCFAIIVERDPSAWILRPDLELVTILYQVVLMLGLRDIVHSWTVGKKGPVFLSMFKPLQLVFAVFMGFIFLKEAIYLGSVIGAAIIAVGFYAILWGKAKEEEMNEVAMLSDDKVPLVHNITHDV